MSNTKQQIEEILDAYANHNYSQSLDFHLTPDMQFMDREQTVEAIDRLVTEACLQEFKPDMQFMDREQTVEAIDRLVTEAKQDVLKELVEWYEYALSVDDTSFDWYRAVKALMVSKDHKKPFSQLSNKENI